MKTVIFAGGYGTRISEESHLKPKPMVEIGGKPILWHIMKIYQTQGFNEFIICLGYKGYMIKEYFLNYFYHEADFTIDLSTNKTSIHRNGKDDFIVTLVDTGLSTKTAGRLQRVEKYLNGEPFMLTYGDGVADVDLKQLITFHKKTRRICTLTAYQPAGKFGVMELEKDENQVSTFSEKPKDTGVWVNAGFFVIEPSVFKYLNEDMSDVMWEQEPLRRLAQDGQLTAFKHDGFWKCMDILNDKNELERMWGSDPKWKIWN